MSLDKVNYGTGRIGEIIKALETSVGKRIKEIPYELKIKGICASMQITEGDLDNVISKNSPVLRPVKGHCFEKYFDETLQQNKVHCEVIGGDNSIDRIVNNKSLQLKTPTLSGTKADIVTFKTHNTHGPKSEQESINYYHSEESFADFLVGLISYKPERIVFLKKENLPRHKTNKKYILSPFSIKWTEHADLNNFKNIGIRQPVIFPSGDTRIPLLKKTSDVIGISHLGSLADKLIIESIVSESNFRIWDMSVRGFLREQVFRAKAEEIGIDVQKTENSPKNRSDKADFNILDKKVSKNLESVQIKGISTNNCKFQGSESIVVTETQLTRGRVNDHPTQSRLYLRSDFKYLLLVLDPPISKLCNKKESVWEYYLIPSSELVPHNTFRNRLASHQRFIYKEIQEYKYRL